MRWVCERLDRKLIPDLTATQLTGEDGGPIETTGTLIRDDRELGRRLALALNRAMPTEIAGEAEVIDATPAEPPVNGTKKPTEAPVLPDDTVGGLSMLAGANGAHEPSSPPDESPAEPEVLFPPRSDQRRSPPPLPEVRRGRENRRRGR